MISIRYAKSIFDLFVLFAHAIDLNQYRVWLAAVQRLS